MEFFNNLNINYQIKFKLVFFYPLNLAVITTQTHENGIK
ncbi:hypothetical protein LEP1GSC085_4763 [Leptospira interrogans str. L0996]|nr:hypothetical protein LEP1GSC085_4763 [Leptospira interrogans str. L0996]